MSFDRALDQAFDRAHQQQTVEALATGVEDLRTRIGGLPGALDGLALPAGAARDALAWCVEQLVDIGTAMLDVFAEVLRGAGAPLRFLDTAARWDEVRGGATGVVGALNPALLPATGAWYGDAAAAYLRASKPQIDAAARLGVVADKVSTALLQVALGGVAFYISVELILGQLLAALGAALVAFASGVLAPVGIGLCVEEAAVTPGLLATAVTSLVTSLGVQVSHFVALHGEALDRSAFPAGRWPDATTGRFADATVTDGDADWSLAH
jgi:hypothetical protein